MTTNPKYYEKMSILLDELIKERKAQVLSYAEYLKKIAALAEQVENPSTSSRYPKSINTPARRALYDNLDENKELAIKVDAEIRRTKPDNWRGTKIKMRVVENVIRRYIADDNLVTRIFEIVKKQGEY